jgi:hypothetical protein
VKLLHRVGLRVPFTSRVLALLPAAAHQRGFWIDRRDDCCTVVGLGGLLLYVERSGGPLLRHYGCGF